jgi:hypothetical protein
VIQWLRLTPTALSSPSRAKHAVLLAFKNNGFRPHRQSLGPIVVPFPTCTALPTVVNPCHNGERHECSTTSVDEANGAGVPKLW